MLCYVCILPLWAAQWTLLMPRRTERWFGTMLGVVSMMSSVLNTTPALVGEAAGVVFLVTRAGLSRAGAISVLAMDQVIVGIAKVCVLVAASLLVDLPRWASRGLIGLSAAVAVGLAALIAISRGAVSLEGVALRVVPRGAARALGDAVAALSPLRSPIIAGGALLIALAKKLMEVAAIVCVQRAFGLNLPIGSAVLVLAALNLSTLFPVMPGNAGVYEATIVVAYGRFGVAAEQALALAVVQHACYFTALALPGYRWLARAAPPKLEATS